MELYLNHISKKYKDKIAVDDVTLRLTPGVWGLLGANGAGKTTLMRMIAGIMQPTTGQVEYDGIPITMLKEKYRDVFGYLPQDFGFYPEFTVKDYLYYMAALKGLTKRDTRQRVEMLIEQMTLQEVRKKKIAKLSGGMKRRVGIAQALLNEPDVLVLDEPTSGLDPGERIRFRNLLSEFSHDKIVLISTHIVSDVEYIAMRNAIMKDGKIVAQGTTKELTDRVEGKVWTGQIPEEKWIEYEKRLRIVNFKNEEQGQISLRYLADEPQIKGSRLTVPRMEDMYLWLFPQEQNIGEEK